MKTELRCAVGFALVTALVGFPLVAGAKKTTIDLWLNHASDDIPLFKKVIQSFEAKNPGIVVRLSNIAGGQTYIDKILVAGAAGSLPDIFYTRGGSGDAQFYARGLATDLTPFVKRDWAEIDGSDLLDAQLVELKYRGKWMAMPYDYSTCATFYNKAMFAEAGIPAFGDTLSWDTAAAVAVKLTKVDANGRRTKAGFGGLPTVPFAQWIEGMLLSDGGAFLNEKLTKCMLDSEGSTRFFKHVTDLVYKQSVAARPTDPASGGWWSQKAAIHITGSWDALPMRKAVKFPFDITGLPCEEPSRQVASATGGSWSIGKSSKNVPEAWTFMKHLISAESTRILQIIPIRSMPSRKSLLPEWSQRIKSSGLDPQNADILWAGVKRNGKNSPVLPFDYIPIILPMLSDLYAGRKGVEQILSTYTQKVDAELAKAWKRKLM